jgi:hypothetical protein
MPDRETILEKFETVANSHSLTLPRAATLMRAALSMLGEEPAAYYSKGVDQIVIVDDNDTAWELAKLAGVEYNCLKDEYVGYCDYCGEEFYAEDNREIYYDPNEGECHAACYFDRVRDYSDYLLENSRDLVYLPEWDNFDKPTVYKQNATFMGQTHIDTFEGGEGLALLTTVREQFSLVNVRIAVYPVMHEPRGCGCSWRGTGDVWMFTEKDGVAVPLDATTKRKLKKVIKPFLEENY